MKKYLKFIIIPLGLSLLVLGYSLVKTTNQSAQPKDAQITQAAQATIEINIDGQKKSYDISNFVGGVLLSAMEDLGIKIEKSGEGESTFITGLGGRSADDQKREFWEFLVNGEQAEVGAGSYAIQNNDKIEWKISNY
jgi:hypothetical protein